MSCLKCKHDLEEHSPEGKCSGITVGLPCNCTEFKDVPIISNSVNRCNQNHINITFSGDICPVCTLRHLLIIIKKFFSDSSSNSITYQIDETLERLK